MPRVQVGMSLEHDCADAIIQADIVQNDLNNNPNGLSCKTSKIL